MYGTLSAYLHIALKTSPQSKTRGRILRGKSIKMRPGEQERVRYRQESVKGCRGLLNIDNEYLHYYYYEQQK